MYQSARTAPVNISPMRPSLFVTGTDTGVGKTLVSTLLLHGLRAHGLEVVGMKPVASGCEHNGAIWCNEDALALQRASTPPLPPYELVNPFALPEPTAPEIAAAMAGMQLDLVEIEHAYRVLAGNGRQVVVEGVGGWLAPLAAGVDQSDLLRRIDAPPVLIVVGLRLGCISHARLTERAVESDGFRVVGWVGSAVDPALPHPEQTVAALQRELSAPCLGVVPHLRQPTGAERHLDVDAVVAALRSGA